MKDRKTPNAEPPLNHYYHPQHCGLIPTESNTTQRQTTQNRRLSNALLLRIPRFNANFHSIIEDRSTTLQLQTKEIPVGFPGLFTMKTSVRRVSAHRERNNPPDRIGISGRCCPQNTTWWSNVTKNIDTWGNCANREGISFGGLCSSAQSAALRSDWLVKCDRRTSRAIQKDGIRALSLGMAIPGNQPQAL